MRLDYTKKGEVHLTMPKHLEDVRTTFDNSRSNVEHGFIEVKKVAHSKAQRTPAPTDIFVVNEECEKLDKEGQEIFHCLVAKMI
jgi:hypothetical protein